MVACSYAPQRTDPTDDLPSDPTSDASGTSPDAPALTPTERCTAKYGALGQFDLCSATETACTFYVDTQQDTTCNAICSGLGGTCLDSRDGDCGDSQNLENCTGTHGDQVCICAP